MKEIKIPSQLFGDIIAYHIFGNVTKEKDIERGLEEKMDKILNHHLYTQFKTAESNEEKESARQMYLDRKGVTKDFRW